MFARDFCTDDADFPAARAHAARLRSARLTDLPRTTPVPTDCARCAWMPRLRRAARHRRSPTARAWTGAIVEAIAHVLPQRCKTAKDRLRPRSDAWREAPWEGCESTELCRRFRRGLDASVAVAAAADAIADSRAASLQAATMSRCAAAFRGCALAWRLRSGGEIRDGELADLRFTRSRHGSRGCFRINLVNRFSPDSWSDAVNEDVGRRSDDSEVAR